MADIAKLSVIVDSTTVDKANKAMDAMVSTSKNLESATDKLNSSFNKLSQSQKKATDDTKKLNSAQMATMDIMGKLKTAALALLGVYGGKELLMAVDQYNQLQGRLKIMTSATGDYLAVSKALNKSTVETGAHLKLHVDTLQKLMLGQKAAGASNDDLVKSLLNLQKVGIISNATTSQMNFGLLEFSKMISMGKVQLREFSAISRDLPYLVAKLGDTMGLTMEEMRHKIHEGELTGKDFMKAMIDMTDSLDKEWQAMPMGIERALNNLKSAFIIFIAEFDKGTGIIKTLANGIQGLANSFLYLSEHIDQVVPILTAFVAILAVMNFGLVAKSVTLLAESFLALAIRIEAAALATTGGLIPALFALKNAFVFVIESIVLFISKHPLILALVIIIAAITAALMALKKEIESVTGTTVTWGDITKGILGGVNQFLDQTKGLLGDCWVAAKNFTSTLFAGLQDVMNAAVNMIPILQRLRDTLAQNIAKAQNERLSLEFESMAKARGMNPAALRSSIINPRVAALEGEEKKRIAARDAKYFSDPKRVSEQRRMAQHAKLMEEMPWVFTGQGGVAPPPVALDTRDTLKVDKTMLENKALQEWIDKNNMINTYRGPGSSGIPDESKKKKAGGAQRAENFIQNVQLELKLAKELYAAQQQGDLAYEKKLMHAEAEKKVMEAHLKLSQKQKEELIGMVEQTKLLGKSREYLVELQKQERDAAAASRAYNAYVGMGMANGVVYTGRGGAAGPDSFLGSPGDQQRQEAEDALKEQVHDWMDLGKAQEYVTKGMQEYDKAKMRAFNIDMTENIHNEIIATERLTAARLKGLDAYYKEQALIAADKKLRELPFPLRTPEKIQETQQAYLDKANTDSRAYSSNTRRKAYEDELDMLEKIKAIEVGYTYNPQTRQYQMRTLEQTTAVIEAVNAAREQGIALNDPEMQYIINSTIALEARNKQMQDAQQIQQNMLNDAQQLGNLFTSAFEDAVLGANSFRQVLAKLLGDLAKMIFQMTIGRQLQAGFTSFFGGALRLFGGGGTGSSISLPPIPHFAVTPAILGNALGNAFGPNGLMAFANGGVVGGPTLFQFANGGAMRNGIAGEAGPEAIMPLRRLSNGRLGVEAAAPGGGYGGLVIQNNITMQVQGSRGGPEQDEILAKKVAKQLDNEIRSKVNDELRVQMRPGNMLNNPKVH